jgi:hypothetical protein
MKSGKEFNNILDECLELLFKGETVDLCLKSYPEQAAELEPLLQTALAARRVATIQPRADFKTRARYQFRSALKESAPRSRPYLGWLPQWATVGIIALVILLAGSGTVVAAGNSMPDNLLYPVKLATEQVRLALTPSPTGKVRLCAEFADRRVAEIVYMANKGDARQVELITRRLDERLVMLAALVSPAEVAEAAGAPKLMAPSAPSAAQAPQPAPTPPREAGGNAESFDQADNRSELRIAVEHYADSQRALLQAALEKAPEGMKPALQQAIDILAADYQRALEALD